MSKINDATNEVIRLLKKDGFLIEIADYASEDWYIKNNGVSKILIDRNCIKTYKQKVDMTDEELDKDLIEYLRAKIPALKNYIVKIKNFFKDDD